MNHYEVLGVPRGATAAEIRKAFHALTLKHHPDKNPDHSTVGSLLQTVIAAYEVLREPGSRAAYDVGLAHAEEAERRRAQERAAPHHGYQASAPPSYVPPPTARGAAPYGPQPSYGGPAPWVQQQPRGLPIVRIGLAIFLGTIGVATIVTTLAGPTSEERQKRARDDEKARREEYRRYDQEAEERRQVMLGTDQPSASTAPSQAPANPRPKPNSVGTAAAVPSTPSATTTPISPPSAAPLPTVRDTDNPYR